MSTEPTCAERIEEHLASRVSLLASLSARENEGTDEEREAAYEERNELPLSVQRETVWKVLLSTGGPGDWFEFHVDSDGDLGRITYHFQDWFDHAQVTLSGDAYDEAETFGRAVTADFYVES